MKPATGESAGCGPPVRSREAERIAIATPEGKLTLCQGKCRGIIAFEAKGENGFGYDPIFHLPELAKTMAELPLELKNQLSHRGQAAQRARKILNQLHN